jgi:nucleotide-binding universal stress UspA family protein
MSELKSILLHVDGSTQCSQRLRVATRLADAHASHVEALYAVMPAVLRYPLAFSVDAQAAPLLVKFEAEQRESVRAWFERERAAAGGMPGVSWSEASDEPVRAFTRRAWGADLLVLGQHDPDEEAFSGVRPDFATSVLIDSGKPGLVLPHVGWDGSLGQTILIAWKSTRESARAVAAALPLLTRARSVHLAAWDESMDGDNKAPLDVEPFLRHHGVNVTVHREGKPTRDLGDLLLSLAADLQADLLVLGCYGHGRTREWVQGGVTRTVFKSMTLPVLMVH